MKKIIIAIISAMILMPTMANTQDTWKPKTPTAEKKFRMGQASISRRGHIYTLTSKTDFTLITEVWTMVLGNGREEALKTINLLIEISEQAGGIYPYKDTNFGIYDNYLKIEGEKGKIYYGDAYIFDKELKMAKKFIEEGK